MIVPSPAVTVAATTPARAALTVPLDDRPVVPARAELEVRAGPPRRALAPQHSRDSLRRREALLRGKEGSRRRRRWENDHFLHNPHAAPPSREDWEVRPAYQHKVVPYQYASLWEHPLFPKSKEAARERRKEERAGEVVPKELKRRVKKAHGALSLLEALEREVREFMLGDDDEVIVENGEAEEEGSVQDDSEEEIVFVSRRRGVAPKKEEIERKEKVLLESRLEDPGASFGRWLVHSIAGYYGLQSWSVTRGDPAMRCAYVAKPRGDEVEAAKTIPRPLYLML